MLDHAPADATAHWRRPNGVASADHLAMPTPIVLQRMARPTVRRHVRRSLTRLSVLLSADLVTLFVIRAVDLVVRRVRPVGRARTLFVSAPGQGAADVHSPLFQQHGDLEIVDFLSKGTSREPNALGHPDRSSPGRVASDWCLHQVLKGEDFAIVRGINPIAGER